MARDDVLHAYAWHQRTSPIDARERLLVSLSSVPDGVVLATCHRIEVYCAAPVEDPPQLVLTSADRDAASVYRGADALAHLFLVAAGLDSAIAGEPQILAQVRRAYTSRGDMPALIARSFEQALHVGRSLRVELGLRSGRSVGSLAVDRLVERLPRPESARVLVVGAGEMGKLAVRALARRVGRVVIANRDLGRASELAAAHGAEAIALAEVPAALGSAEAVVSAADTRGNVLGADLLRARCARGPFVVIDIAVPRSVDAAGRDVLGTSYLSVDDLTADARVSDETLARATLRCREEAAAFIAAREPGRVDAIRALRDEAERLRSARVRRAMRKLDHLSPRDRAIVETLSTSLTNALLHRPTVELRQR